MQRVREGSSGFAFWPGLLLLVLSACAPDWSAREDDAGADAEQRPGDAAADATSTKPEDDVAPAASVAMCSPGALRCDLTATAVEVCTMANAWQTKEACGASCLAGVCTGMCVTGAMRCGIGQTPEACENGQWVAQTRCPAACIEKGVCAGVCQPGAVQCDPDEPLVRQVCNELGQWVGAETCSSVCSSGTCSGTCQYKQRRCGANRVAEKCSEMGTWEPAETCEFVCSGDGVCSGECVPGARDCQGQVPRSCDPNTGKWVAAAACVQQACVTGSCIGSCAPETLRCGASETVESCSATGQWTMKTKCPAVCSGQGVCSGQCSPGKVDCSGATLRTCRPDGSGYNELVCQPTAAGETASCSGTSCLSTCTATPGKCPGSSKCWSLAFGCAECIEPFVWRNIPSAPGGDRICVPFESVERVTSENAAHPNNVEPAPSDFCKQGFFWRDAFVGDHICVSFDSRKLAAEENGLHSSRTRVGVAP